jgi:hypothetical protein
MCKNRKFFDILCMFCSISSKLLLVVFCRFLSETRGDAAQIHPQDFPKNPLWFGNYSSTFSFVNLSFMLLFLDSFLYKSQTNIISVYTLGEKSPISLG